MALHVLVLAGGSGTRLWPLSRGRTPKHLLPLGPGGRTLLRATLERVSGIGDSVHVVTAAAQSEACLPELEAVGLGRESLIAEPAARGTGPALGLACALLARDRPDGLIASVHADHRVADVQAYRASLVAVAGWARATGGLGAVGMTPAEPATGLGYIALDRPLDAAEWRSPGGPAGAVFDAAAAVLPAFSATGFAEKPDAATAERFVAGGRHLWNLGLFAWPARRFLDELAAAAPETADVLLDVAQALQDGDQDRAAALYESLATVPVEPLVLERAAGLTVVQAQFGWSDVGSWADLHAAALAAGEADSSGNVWAGDAILQDARGCTVEARGGRLIAVVGGEDLVVVDTGDVVLVMPAARSQEVKSLVERLRAEGWTGLL